MHIEASWLTSMSMNFVSFTSEQDLSDKIQNKMFRCTIFIGPPCIVIVNAAFWNMEGGEHNRRGSEKYNHFLFVDVTSING